MEVVVVVAHAERNDLVIHVQIVDQRQQFGHGLIETHTAFFLFDLNDLPVQVFDANEVRVQTASDAIELIEDDDVSFRIVFQQTVRAVKPSDACANDDDVSRVGDIVFSHVLVSFLLGGLLRGENLPECVGRQIQFW